MKYALKRNHLLGLAFVSAIQVGTIQFSSASASGEGLIEIYQKAVNKDPVLAGAQYAADAGKEKSRQGLSLLLPRISVTANASYDYSKNQYGTNAFNLPDSETLSKNNTYGFQVSQPLFRMADIKAYSQSKIVTLQTEIQLKQAEQNLMLRVSQAYFDVLSANENLQVANSQSKAFKESLERAKLTFKVGTSTKTDKLEAQARYDLAKANEISATNQLAIAKQSLASIIGENPSALKKLKSNANLTKLKANNIQYWVDTATARNLELGLVKSGYKISKIEVQKLKSDRLPTLDLVASANKSNRYNSFFDKNIDTTNASINLQLSMPIYSGGLVSSRIREAESLKFQQQQNKINAQRQVVLQAQQAYLNSYNGLQQVDALQQALKSSHSALEATKKGVEVGVRTNVDFLDSQQQYYSTERDYRVAKYNYLLSVLTLKAAAGILTKADIEELDGLLK